MDNISLQCQIQGHEQSPIQLLCINKECLNKNKLICLNCLGDHQQHINQLIQIGNINSQIKYLRSSIKENIENTQQEKQQILKKISENIEKIFQESIKALQQFDNILKGFIQGQPQASENYLRLTNKLVEYCEIDTNKNQSAKDFLQLKYSILDNTIFYCLKYFENLEKKLLGPFNVKQSERIQSTKPDQPIHQKQQQQIPASQYIQVPNQNQTTFNNMNDHPPIQQQPLQQQQYLNGQKQQPQQYQIPQFQQQFSSQLRKPQNDCQQPKNDNDKPIIVQTTYVPRYRINPFLFNDEKSEKK